MSSHRRDLKHKSNDVRVLEMGTSKEGGVWGAQFTDWTPIIQVSSALESPYQ